MNRNNDDLERGHLDSEDSLLSEDEGPTVEMGNPLKTLTTAVAPSNFDANDTLNSIKNFNKTNNPDRPQHFSDDEGSSVASSKVQLNVFDDEGAGVRARSVGAGANSSIDIRCRASSECGSMIVGTMQLQATTPAAGDEEGDVTEDPPPPPTAARAGQDRMMEDVDLGSTNRIMGLRGVNNSSGGRGNDGGSYNDEVAAVRECSTAEPTPAPIIPGDVPSSEDELNEVRILLL